MAWDTEMTRRRLLDAATIRFAADGLAGARVDAIAHEAGVNKERIYSYFGDKRGLFEAVLAGEVERLLHGVVVTDRGADALASVAMQLHDRVAAHPLLPRLLAWESLELREPVDAVRRTAGCAAMVALIAEALPCAHDRAAHLLLSVVAMVLADGCLPHLARLIAPHATPAGRREALIAQARALAG